MPGGGVDETPVLHQEREDAIQSLEIALPPDQRMVVFLRTSLKKTFRQIGKALGITPAAAQKRYERARETLRARCAELLSDYECRDEPETWPPEVRATTAIEMQIMIADMRANGASLTDEEEAKLLEGLPKRRDWRAVY